MQQESTKKEYGQHVHDGVFTLFILSTTGGIGRKATPFYKSLADGISKGGFAAACMSSTLPFNAFVEADPLAVNELKLIPTSEGCVPPVVQ